MLLNINIIVETASDVLKYVCSDVCNKNNTWKHFVIFILNLEITSLINNTLKLTKSCVFYYPVHHIIDIIHTRTVLFPYATFDL